MRVHRHIASHSYSHNLRDEHVIDSNKFRIKSFYDKQQVSERRSIQSTTATKNYPRNGRKTKPDFRVSSGFGHSPRLRFPWRDDLLLSEISGNNPSSIPRSLGTITQDQVRRHDAENTDRYSDGSRRLPRRLFSLFSRAGISAAYSCGIIPQSDGERFKPADDIIDAVMSISKSTNAGWPTLLLKNSDQAISDAINWLSITLEKPTFRNVIGLNPMIVEKGEKFLKLVKTGKRRKYRTMMDHDIFCNPTYIFHRFQPSYNSSDDSLEIKSRQVWCIPFRIVSLENYFFKNVLESHKSNNVNSANPSCATGLTNFQISKRIISRLRRQLHFRPGHSFWSLDYSKFDSTVPNWAYDIFFTIMEQYIELNPNEKRVYNLLRCYLKFTPYIMEDELFFKRRGVPSGSLLTSMIDTWFNLVLWHACELLKEKDPDICDELVYGGEVIQNIHCDFNHYFMARQSPRTDICVQGDDVCIVTDDFEIQLHRSLCFSLGMTVTNKDPVNSNDEAVFFLGRYWDTLSRPFQTEQYITSHIITCSKYYSQKHVDFNVNYVRLYRILSICLPLSNGIDYLDKTFCNWKPYIKWKQNKESFFLLKEWPNDDYIEVSHDMALRWEML
jgi:hypothetical protein